MSYLQINKEISDNNMTTKFLQGDPPMLKVCTDPLTEDNNRNFARGSPNEISPPTPFGKSGISSTN